MDIPKLDVLRPIPDLDDLRQIKALYRDMPVERSQGLFEEPLVPLADYGVKGVSYYSQPNPATGEAVPGVSSDIYIRQTVAEKLAAVNWFLQRDPTVAWALGGPVQLYVRDGFRSPQLQAHLHHQVIPNLLRTQNPDWTEAQVIERRNQVIANPDYSDDQMPPHFSGGPVDVILVSAQGEILNTGFRSAHLGNEAIHTDYLEKLTADQLATAGLEQALMTRRVLHNVLTSDDERVGGLAMAPNPTETWHYSYGDQMWALYTGQPAALYGIPTSIPDELHLVG